MPLYVKVRSASGKIGIPENMADFLSKAAELKTPTIVISFGNPYVIGAFPKAQALVCAYSDAEVLVEATVEALFGEIEVRGTLPVSIPGLCDFGSGIHYAQSYLRKDNPSNAGFDAHKLTKIDEIITQAIRDSAFPAAQVAVVKDGIIAYNRAFGTYTYDQGANAIDGSTLFDLASLTKVFATTVTVMKLYDQQKLSLDDHVAKYFPQFSSGAKRSITLQHLLLHTSGLPPFRKLYDVCKSPAEALDSILATPLVAMPGDSTVYSDLGMIILGKIVEQIAGVSLSTFVTQEFYQPLRMNSTVFTPSKAVRMHTAPTEVDTLWRKALVQGTVHDENAALLGGVAGNAGLFSTASDLAVFMQMIMNKGVYGGMRYLSDSTVVRFTRRENRHSTRALGWDFKSERGSSAGDLFSMSSFGHTGFTGTSVWADPERNMFVVFLTNRVYPTRANTKIFKVRPMLHDAVVQALLEETDSSKMGPRVK
jgi:CubicO group peptidase (beta-lactamase class C family)